MTGPAIYNVISLAAEGGRNREDDMWLAIIVVGMVAIVFSLGRMLRNRRRSAARTQTPAASAPALGRAATAQLDELLRDIEVLAREMNARLDTKIKTLETLIRQADERIARLDASGGATGSIEPPAPTSEAAGGNDAPPADDGREEIYKLADEGLSIAEISKRTGTLAGEVELILGLRSRRKEPTQG